MSALRFEQFTDRSNVVYLFHRESVLVANMRHDPFEHHRCASEGLARRWAVTNGWTDYTITEGEK